MFLGLVYFIVIVFANTLGAVSGMGGGVLIKPIFDAIGRDSVATISFYATVAVFTMSVVAMIRQLRGRHVKVSPSRMLWLAIGAVGGGVVGKMLLSQALAVWSEQAVLATQIVLTIATLLFAFFNTRLDWQPWGLTAHLWYLGGGVGLGFFASYLGIGGGPINVALLMLMFGMPIKQATVYSLSTIFCSQAAKLVSIVAAGELGSFDLTMLWAIVPAAIVGGFVGSHLSHVLSDKHVTAVFQTMLLAVIAINAYNGLMLWWHW